MRKPLMTKKTLTPKMPMMKADGRLMSHGGKFSVWVA
jgi:hypothetical protein